MKLLSIGLSCWLVLCGAAAAQAQIIFDQSDNTNYRTGLQRSDFAGSGIGRLLADDFRFTQNAVINQVNVRGVFKPDGFWGDAISGAVVRIYADNGTGLGPATSPVFTQTVTQAFTPFLDLLGGEVDASMNIALTTPFTAQANTKYWLSVQAVTTRDGSEFKWLWNNDTAHPSAYATDGVASVRFDGTEWDSYGRWWDPGDLFDGGPFWITRSYNGALPISIPVSGTLGQRTAVDGQGLDLNFDLLGSTVAAAVPEPGSMTLAIVVAVTATIATAVTAKRKCRTR